MSWVDQTTYFDPSDPDNPNKGNCTEASVASILGLELEDVPNFREHGNNPYDFWDAFESFIESKGLHVLSMPGNHVPDCLYLASGPAARGCKHMVVMRDGKLAHDPHHSRAGLQSIDRIYVLIPKDLRHYGK